MEAPFQSQFIVEETTLALLIFLAISDIVIQTLIYIKNRNLPELVSNLFILLPFMLAIVAFLDVLHESEELSVRSFLLPAVLLIIYKVSSVLFKRYGSEIYSGWVETLEQKRSLSKDMSLSDKLKNIHLSATAKLGDHLWEHVAGVVCGIVAVLVFYYVNHGNLIDYFERLING